MFQSYMKFELQVQVFNIKLQSFEKKTVIKNKTSTQNYGIMKLVFMILYTCEFDSKCWNHCISIRVK